MEPQLCVPEEHRSVDSDSNRSVPQVIYREIDWLEDLEKISPLIWEFQYTVNNHELDIEVIMHGIKFTGTEVYIASLKSQNYNLIVAECDSVVMGYMLFKEMAEGAVLFIKQMYILPEFRNFKLSFGLVESLPYNIGKVLFQTKSNKPPDSLFLKVGNRIELIREDSEMKTWIMNWGKNEHQHE